jgi:hypothetical protein
MGLVAPCSNCFGEERETESLPGTHVIGTEYTLVDTVITHCDVRSRNRCFQVE